MASTACYYEMMIRLSSTFALDTALGRRSEDGSTLESAPEVTRHKSNMRRASFW